MPNTTITIEILSAPAPVLVQDGGRPGFMHQGIPPGGALVPELLAAANRAAGNPWNAAAFEIFGELTLTVRGGPLWMALNQRGWLARADESITLPRPTAAFVNYLAIYGGIDVPVILGGRGTLLSAGLGGHEGRLLRAGDTLVIGVPPARARRSPYPVALDINSPIRAIPDSDKNRFDRGAVASLFSATFTLASARDRVGMRLIGPRLNRIDDDTRASTPMVRGAIQVPASGELIVLGPDHPTTGGYPVIATVIRADLGRLAAQRPGMPVRFQEATLAEARAAWRRYAAALLE